MERPRFTELKPDGSYNRSKDIVERLLDSMADEVFVLRVRGKVDEEAYAAVRRALGNMTARSRHIGQEPCRVLKSVQREKAGDASAMPPGSQVN